MWPAIEPEQQPVGYFLTPGEGALSAVNFNTEIVFPSVGDARRGQGTKGLARVAQQSRSVVVERSRRKGLQNAGNLLGNQPRDEASEVVAMRADIAETTGSPRPGRIG